jgi:hypothetical protein
MQLFKFTFERLQTKIRIGSSMPEGSRSLYFFRISEFTDIVWLRNVSVYLIKLI